MLMRAVLGYALAVGLVVPVSRAHGQERLASVADQARRAWAAHSPGAIVGGAEGVQVQLPGSRSPAGMPPGQVVAMLGAFLRRSIEVEVRVVSVREMGGGRGFVELRRSFRERGTQEVRTQRVLLGYRRGGERWVLVEVRVLD